MFSFLFGPPPVPTRFEKCIELKQIHDMIMRIRKKEYEMERASASKGAGSPDYAKHTILSTLLHDIDAALSVFNEQPVRADHAEEVRDMLNLLNALNTLVSNTLNTHRPTLNIFRDNRRENADATLRSTVGVLGVATFFMTPLSLIPRIGMLIGLGVAGNSLEEYMGLNSRITKTVAILTEFQSILRESRHNLQLNGREGRDNPARLILPQGNGENNGLLYTYSPATKEYIDSIRDKPKQISTLLKELKLTDAESAELEPFLCPILLSVMDIPVMVGGHEFDLDSLLALPVDGEDQRINPFTRHKFFVRDIQPANKTYCAILEIIERIKLARGQKGAPQPAPIIRPSAPPAYDF